MQGTSYARGHLDLDARSAAELQPFSGEGPTPAHTPSTPQMGRRAPPHTTYGAWRAQALHQPLAFKMFKEMRALTFRVQNL